MNCLFVACAGAILFLLELLYFKLADKYNIIDKPNHRSSHTRITIRGGGIIFSLSILLAATYNFEYPYFIIGMLLIAIVSFIDDIKPLSSSLRIIAHLLAVTLLFSQVKLFIFPWFIIPLTYVFVIGSINAINFMDGINGITGGYGLIVLITLWYINQTVEFANNQYLITPIIAVSIFCFFNFREKAMCFAGDVGSISLAFIIIFFLVKLIIKTHNIAYISLLLVYGLDSVTTIVFRLIRRENIFEAHRGHFYQFLANEKQIPHVCVSGLYMITQAVINVILVNILLHNTLILLLCIFAATLVFVFLRIKLEGSKNLLKEIN